MFKNNNLKLIFLLFFITFFLFLLTNCNKKNSANIKTLQTYEGAIEIGKYELQEDENDILNVSTVYTRKTLDDFNTIILYKVNHSNTYYISKIKKINNNKFEYIRISSFHIVEGKPDFKLFSDKITVEEILKEINEYLTVKRPNALTNIEWA